MKNISSDPYYSLESNRQMTKRLLEAVSRLKDEPLDR